MARDFPERRRRRLMETAMNLPALKEQRASKVDSLRALVTAAANENRDLNDSEQAAFNSGKAEIERPERDITNETFLAEAERRAHGEPVNGTGDKHFDGECREFSLRKAILAQMPGFGFDIDVGREREISRELERRAGVPAQGMFVPTAV